MSESPTIKLGKMMSENEMRRFSLTRSIIKDEGGTTMLRLNTTGAGNSANKDKEEPRLGDVPKSQHASVNMTMDEHDADENTARMPLSGPNNTNTLGNLGMDVTDQQDPGPYDDMERTNSFREVFDMYAGGTGSIKTTSPLQLFPTGGAGDDMGGFLNLNYNPNENQAM